MLCNDYYNVFRDQTKGRPSKMQPMPGDSRGLSGNDAFTEEIKEHLQNVLNEDTYQKALSYAVTAHEAQYKQSCKDGLCL